MAQLFRENLPLIAIALILIAAYLFLRTRPSPVESMEEFNALITGGNPVVVELFSNA